MTLPTVPLIDGAYYWVRWGDQEQWVVAEFHRRKFWLPERRAQMAREDLAAISGPIPTPDEVE